MRCAWGTCALLALAGYTLPAPAFADRAFAERFSANANGDIAVVGNTLETCLGSAADCLTARAGKGKALNNNGFAMGRVDVDQTGLDSSSARLSLPAGARVLFAGLYYGARVSAGARGKAAPDSSPSALRTVELKLPGGSRFERVRGEVDESSHVTGAYGAFVNVTSEVSRGGPGTYTVAGVQSATGEDRYAGWALAVAYEAAGDPPRNLTVFDGLQSVTQGKPALTIPASGFQTPLSGAVRTKLGFVAYEGDFGLSGDSATLDGRPLSNAVDPANNFFNSTISVGGRNVTDKTPDFVNQLGFDAKLIPIDGILPNAATSARIALRTSSDQYLPQTIAFATDLYAPVIRANKTVIDLTHLGGPAREGDTLRYTVHYVNDGLEPARAFVGEDVVPAGTTYLPGSLRIPGAPPGSVEPTDVRGDDLAEYDGTARSVRFFLGAGAAAGAGGELGAAGRPGDRATVSFEVRVDQNATAEHEIVDVAHATFLAPTLNNELGAISSPAAITVGASAVAVPEADLATVQQETVAPSPDGGDIVDDHILIENHGPADATDVHVHDIAPPGATIESASVDHGSCTEDAGEAECRLPHLDGGGTAEVDLVVREPAVDAQSGSHSVATVTASQFDPTPANNADEESVGPPAPFGGAPLTADLAVAAHVSPAVTPLGGHLTETLTVTNHGPGTATGVELSGVLDAPTQPIHVEPGGATCSTGFEVRCTVATLPSGASRTIELSVRPLSAGRVIGEAAVSAGQTDSNHANNAARIAATVTPRASGARLRIVPIRPVARNRQLVAFVVTAAVTKSVPTLAPLICVRLPAGLRLVSAPRATVTTSGVCWRLAALTAAHSFRLRARVGTAPRSGATYVVRGRLTGANVSAARSVATVRVAPVAIACPARAAPDPRARVAC